MSELTPREIADPDVATAIVWADALRNELGDATRTRGERAFFVLADHARATIPDGDARASGNAGEDVSDRLLIAAALLREILGTLWVERSGEFSRVVSSASPEQARSWSFKAGKVVATSRAAGPLR
jgi:hypothetical protein